MVASIFKYCVFFNGYKITAQFKMCAEFTDIKESELFVHDFQEKANNMSSGTLELFAATFTENWVNGKYPLVKHY